MSTCASNLAAMPRHLRLMKRATLVATGTALLLATAACSSNSSTPSSSTSGVASANTASLAAPTTSASGSTGTGAAVPGITAIPAADLSPAGTFGTRPTVTVPSGSPPSQLEAWDLIAGTGATAAAGETVNVQYDGYSWTNRKEFDASWNRGQALSFSLGVGQVIKGWDEGVAGMKVGGRREIIIPPRLAYGAQSPTSAIAPNDTLIFVVDLVSIGSSSP
jgi:peptidylprolyl isomerase